MAVMIGIISDTHGLIRQSAIDALKKSDIIIHAGDIGNIDVINELEKLAPVYAIKGNNDTGNLANAFEETKVIEINEMKIYVIHDIKKINFDPEKEGYNIVIYGHSHKASKRIKNEILYINPGGAGRKRFDLPLSVALLNLSGNRHNRVKFIYL